MLICHNSGNIDSMYYFVYYSCIRAVVAQLVEHFLGKEEVRQFESAQQLQKI